MLKRWLLCQLTILALSLANLPVSQAQTIPARGRSIPISSYEDDPYVRESDVKRVDSSRFDLGEDRRPLLASRLVTLSEESKIYRRDQTGVFKPFAWNPWPRMTTANAAGNFIFQNEERFPLHGVERDADGKIILKDGLQVWTPRNLHLGNTTTFEAANAAKDAAESWAGRDIVWGVNGVLDIEPHVFIEFNAFYSANTRTLHFGVVPYRLPGQTDIKMFETATCWELVAHECGHALHHALKPNREYGYQEYQTWSESLSDQVAMWASLRNRERVQRLVAETHGNLNQSNALTRNVEAFAALTGKGAGIRDAFNDLKVSDTSDEVHDRSRVLTGAVYKIFLTIYDELKPGLGAEDALRQAGQIMGFFLMRATDYTPENRGTLEDVAKAYLKVDKEFFGGRYHALLVDEFMRRELFDAGSVREWQAHEAATPDLRLPGRVPDEKVEELLQANLDKLYIWPDFGLKLQSVTRINALGASRPFNRLWPSRVPVQTIVRVQLTRGRGEGAKPLDNHGILVFRANGTLADYHAPLTPGDQPTLLPDVPAQTQALAQLAQAEQINLDRHGVPLTLVRKPDGQWTVEAHVPRGEGLNAYQEVFTLDNPRGERREIMIPPVPPDKRIPIADDLLK